MKKIILLVIDGLGDDKIPEFKNRTPLEAARTPNMDYLAEKGVCGKMNSFWFKEQHYPRSDSAHLALFGFNPKEEYLGRGPYEAAALDVDLEKGDLAFRINFATFKKEKIIDRRAGRIKNKKPFVKALKGIKIDGVEFIVKSGIEHRGVLILRDNKNRLSKEVTSSDPKEINNPPKKVKPKEKTKKAEFTAKILNKFFSEAYQILKDHPQNKEREKKGLLPANYLLARGAGTYKKMKSFEDKFNLKGGSITGGGVYKGVSKAVGMDIIKKNGKDKFGDEDLEEKFNLVIEKIKSYDFIFCHIKKIDNLSHDGDFKEKKNFLEKIDKKLKDLITLKNTVIIITGDHSTSCLKKEHTTKPLPILISDSKKDKVDSFSEKSCQKGELGELDQVNVMKKAIKIANN
ncbi:MAG: alkaline phosphatase family protein [Minisyncoccales bacterium]